MFICVYMRIINLSDASNPTNLFILFSLLLKKYVSSTVLLIVLFLFFFARFVLTSWSTNDWDIFCVKILPYLNYLFLIALASACHIESQWWNSMSVQKPGTVKVKFVYKSAKIRKEVRKRSWLLLTKHFKSSVKPALQILN